MVSSEVSPAMNACKVDFSQCKGNYRDEQSLDVVSYDRGYFRVIQNLASFLGFI